MGKSRTNSDIDLYNSRLQGLADEMSVQLIDVNSLFKANKGNLLTDDGVHPNATGHDVLFKFIKSRLQIFR